jgi:hypothetical protein
MNKDTLQEVQDLAAVFFTPNEITQILGIDESLQFEDDFKQAYKKGQLITEAQLRKGIFKLAKQGSSPAQNLAMKILENTKLNEIRYE